MKKWKAAVGIFLIFAVSLFVYRMPSDAPYFNGPFHWSRMEIKVAEVSHATAFPVYASIETMKVIFQMEVGDECYFLKDDGWRWRDTKDLGFALAPVFCPKKGGGWAMLPGE